MVCVEKIIIPHSEDCKKAKKAKKVGCSNVETIETELFFKTEKDMDDFRNNMQRERQIKDITLWWTERHFFINDNCIFI